ncbi:MAG TPA: inositol monophosphatase [Amycolatopsis sp.]|nr:inositol monophosphatase [Amycolatopsis sp.]
MTRPDPGFAEFIETCLREASKVAIGMRGTGEVTVKPEDVNQLVTDTDLAIGALLTGRIRERYPRHAILEEESGGTPGDRITWIVDPLDGTSNYAAGSPLYGVMMAAVGAEGVLAGGLALPAFDTVYVAESGRGATRNGRPLAQLPATAPEQSLVAFGMDKGTPEVMAGEGRLAAALGMACLGVRMSNSVFDICMVADGAYGAFVHRGCRIWDVAAALCVLEECGGVCTDLDGRPLDLTDSLTKAEQVFEVCLASASVHPAVMTALRAAAPA